jgi:predicted acetyltransferase
MRLLLRAVREDDESAVRAAQAALEGSGFSFAIGLDAVRPFAEYVRSLEDHRHGRNLAPGFVSQTFLVAEIGGVLVGRIALRHELTDALRRVGGHIGFGVLPTHQRRGYATEMLRHTLELARARGLDRVLLTCDEGNLGSRTVIERCGGVLTRTLPPELEREPIRQYWIELAAR